MTFPVDLLANVSHSELAQSGQNYMNNLLYNRPDSPPQLTVSDFTKVPIDISSISMMPMYGDSDKERILVLFFPRSSSNAVALYLLDQWWTVDDILKTADTARNGAMEVQTVGERIVLYILNRVVYRAKEMDSEEIPFLCHGKEDYAKILWRNGEAVGFYSVKPTDKLPVMDSVFVRKSQRAKGFGLQMLEDFVHSFSDNSLGLRFPLTNAMYKVCKKYLCKYPGDTNLLWEVEHIGRPNQWTNIARKIKGMDLRSVSGGLCFTEEAHVITDVTGKVVQTEELTVEIVEEATVLIVTKEAEVVPVAVRGRSDSKTGNSPEKGPEDKSEKVLRIEDIEAVTEEQHASVQGKTVHHVPDLELTESRMAAEETGKDLVDSVPEDEAAAMLDKLATALPPHDLEESDVVATPLTKGPQVGDDATQYPKNELQIIENVTSEIEETEEECQKKDTGELVSSEEPLEIHKGAETLNEVGEGTEMIQNETHQQPQEAGMEETTAKDGGNIVTQSTVLSTSTPTHAIHNQEICEEVEKVVDEDADKNESFTIEVEEQVTGTERNQQEEITSLKEDLVTVENLLEGERQQDEAEQLTNEVEAKKEDSEVDASTKLPDTAETDLEREKVRDEPEKEQRGEEVETSVIQDKQEDSDEHIEEPPVVQMRTVKGRKTVSHEPKPRKKNTKTDQNQEPTDQADMRAGGSAEEKAEEQLVDQRNVEDEKTVDKTEKEILTMEICESALTDVTFPTAKGAAVDIITSSEMNMEENREVEEEDTCMGSGMNKDAVPPSKTETSDEVQGEVGGSGLKESHDKDITSASEVDKLQKATVILVDLRTTCHHLSVNKPEEKTSDKESADPGMEQMKQMELVAAEEKQEKQGCITETQTSGPQTIMLGEEDGRKAETFTEKSEHDTKEVETVEKGGLDESNSGKEEDKSASVDEKEREAAVVKTGGKSNQQQREDNSGEDTIEKEVEKADGGTVEVGGATGAVAKEAEIVLVVAEEKVSECVDTKAKLRVGDDGEEGPVVETRSLRSGTKRVLATPTRKTARSRKQVDEGEQSHDEDIALTTTTETEKGKISVSVIPKDATGEKEAVKEAVSEKSNKEGEEMEMEPPTKGDESKAPDDEDRRGAKGEELVRVEVEKISEKGTMSKTEEEENTAGVTAVTADAPEVGRAGTSEAEEDDNTEAPVVADERKPSDDNAEQGVTKEDTEEGEQSVSTSGLAETAAGPSAQKMLLVAKDKPKEDEAVTAKQQDETTKRREDEQEMEASTEKITEDETLVETRVLRKGRRTSLATPKHISKRARTQYQQKDEVTGVTTPAEETEREGNEAAQDKQEEMDDEEVVAHKEDANPEDEMKEAESVPLTLARQETAVSQTGSDEQGEVSVGERAEEKPTTDKGNITDEEEAPAVEPRVLRSAQKRANTREPAGTTPRKGWRDAPSTPRLRSKRAQTRCQQEEAATPAEEAEAENEEATQKKLEKAEEEEGRRMEMEVAKQKGLDEVGSLNSQQEAPAVTSTPQNNKTPSNKRFKVKKSEEKRPQSTQKRRLRKRKTEVTPERKSKRHTSI